MTSSAERGRRRRLAALMVLLALVLLPALARAQDAPAQDGPALDPLRAQVAARWGVPADRVVLEADTTLLARAADGAELRLGNGGGDGRFVVRAGVHSDWVRAGVLARVPVAAHAIARGAAVADALRVETQLRWGAPVATDTVLAGHVAARTLAAGSALLPPAVRGATAVRAGQDVTLVLHRGPVHVELEARAAGTGGVGDTIAVRSAGGRRLRAVIREPGTVQLVSAREER